MKHYTLVFDRRNSELISMEPYDDSSDALNARFDAEAANRGRSDIEVVVLSADSIEGLKRTHSRYFGSPLKLASEALKALRNTACSDTGKHALAH